jgi:TnpA family transposase
LVTYANRFFDKQAYGRLCKTTFICKYLLQLKLRHRINTQLHKGEQLHNLRAYLWFGGDGVIRKKQEHQQQITAQALNVLSNIVMVWNTVKRETAILSNYYKNLYAYSVGGYSVYWVGAGQLSA